MLWMVGWVTCPLWVAPALYYNLDWHGKDVFWDNVWAVVMTLAAAACFLALHWLTDLRKIALTIFLGLGLTFNNSWNALENISTMADRHIDGRKAQIKREATGSSARSG
jgi:glycine betaine/choline ABC-type transport system substrate-binding protein